MKLVDALDAFLRKYSKPRVRYNADRLLRPMVEWLGTTRDADRVTALEVQEWINMLNEREVRWTNHPKRSSQEGKLSPYTVHSHIRSIRAFFNWLTKMDVIAPDKNPVRNIRQRKLPNAVSPDRIATDEEVMLITMACFGHIRNYAIVLLMRDTGCRAMEIAGLTLEHLHLEDRYARVLGKGDIWRDSFFGDECAAALERWLTQRSACPTAHVFCATRKPYKHLTSTAVSDVIERAAVKAGIERPIHSHHFRHWRGTNLLQEMVDGPTAAAAIGDSYAVFQAHYAHTSRERVQQAVKKTAYKSPKQHKNIIRIEDAG